MVLQLLILSAFRFYSGKEATRLRVGWIAYQLIFRESGRRELEFLLSDCKRGWSLEIKQSCQKIVRNEVEYKVSHK